MAPYNKMSPLLAFSQQQRAECVRWYHETHSVTQTQRNYHTKYAAKPPVRNSILNWASKFETRGTVENESRSGRPQLSSQHEKRVSTYFNRHPSNSIRSAERDLAIPRSSIHRILHNRLHMFPYKIQMLQELEDRDPAARTWFANWCMENIQSDRSFLHRIIFSDECVFHVDGKVNKHNVRIWGTENPHAYREVARNSDKVTVWCAMSVNGVIGPYYFDEPNVSGASYLQLLKNFFLPMTQCGYKTKRFSY